ncbi:MAG: 4-hydroxythreonine-4-phosphate dehydrogenase PdxA [Verrucomicrobiales bacterium]|nr:4-hydroxythreonine-4-phosphate dehydrogenase PdxA [Verrucomicrobiales bacterium]
MRILGVTLGDATGIGPEVALKAAVSPEFARAALVLIGDEGTVARAARLAGIGTSIRVLNAGSPPTPGLWRLPWNGAALPPDLAPGAPEASLAAVDWLREGARRCLEDGWAGMVTAPVSKEAILRTGTPFVGQTEFLTELAGSPPTAMMLLGTDDRGRWLRVSLATTHLPLRRVPDALTVDGLSSVIRLTWEACRRLGISSPRVAVCGLNPHAGEGGLMGTEEREVLRPAIAAAREMGCAADGPESADTLFHRAIQGSYDAVVAMYHDQGLAPLKLVAFDTGVNWTLGLPFVRTSPDHGTAHDLAGRGVARPDSMAAAIRLALALAERSSEPWGRNPYVPGTPVRV